ncbi:FtsX-like permease family protein [Nocardioides flavescens]|uniref:FtsX-like permease family protein n=1 Tax=Nocardioides flavescens TaxID=2691959 RepID=A0A6L7ER83_9ACTN|nr:FtsX-like permease family protein [Nocardioides flavescens]MXG88098.1 FtsX-like permease family protein [Nocardioides flavescens]
MRTLPRPHGPSVRGRLRTDRGLLVLTAAVVALVTALLAAVGPLTVRTADRAVAASVRDAGTRGAVVATVAQPDSRGPRRRDPGSVERLAGDVESARSRMPRVLAAAVRPGVVSLTSKPLQLTDAGPGRYLRLAYVATASGPPSVTWVDGEAPASSAAPGQEAVVVDAAAPPWPVQVGLSTSAASALGVGAGDQLEVEDEARRSVDVRVSGIFSPVDPDDEAWLAQPGLLSATTGTTEGVVRTSATALVGDASLPDLRIGVPSDDLSEQVSFLPVPEDVTWRGAPALRRAVVGLQSGGQGELTGTGFDTLLDRVLDDALTQVATARGQAQLLLVGLTATALLVLVLGAQLLVRRRAGTLALARERGAGLLGLGLELAVESVLVTAVGTALGLGAVLALLGPEGWTVAPSVVLVVVVVAGLAAPVLGAVEAARATGARRVPANRAARRALVQARATRRLLLEGLVVTAAVLSLLALRQRGVGDGDLAVGSVSTWWALVAALLLVRALPLLVRPALRWARRTSGLSRLVVVARVAEAGTRALPLTVLTVAVAQLVLGVSLAATERAGQEAGARVAVGGDARLRASPEPSLVRTAATVAAAPGVRTAVAARVTDARLSSSSQAVDVRLVVVDAAAWARLLDDSDLPAGSGPARLEGPGRVRALVSGGSAAVGEGAQLRWDDAVVPLDVVGTAPQVEGSAEPVVVVDTRALAGAGTTAPPDTVWATGPGAVEAVRAAAEAGDDVTTYAGVLAQRRAAPLPSALVALAAASALVLLALAALGVVLAATVDAPARRVSAGRLRSLGVPDRTLLTMLTGELLVPVLAGVVAGLVAGATCAAAITGHLGLEVVTGETAPPSLVVPWWVPLAALLVALVVPVLAVREAAAVRRASLARLLRGGGPG